MDKDKKEAMPYGAPRSPEDAGDAGKGDDGSKAKPEGSGKEGDGGGTLFAGKYDTPEKLAEAYESSQAKIGEQGSELDKLRKQNEFLSEQLKRFAPSDTPQEGNRDTVDDSAPAEDLASDLAAIQQMLNEGEIDMGEAIALSSHITEQRTLSGVDSLVSDRINQALRAKDTETLQGQFMKANPDFTEAMRSGEIQAIMSEDPLHDPFSAFHELKARRLAASQEQAVKEAYEKGRLETLAKGAAGTEKVLQQPGAGPPPEVKPTPENRHERLKAKLREIRTGAV